MKNALKYVRWLYVHSKGARWQLTANVLLGTVNVALNMAFILVCKHLVDIATGVAEGSLLTWSICAGAIMVSRLAVSAINVRIENLVNSRMNFAIRAELYGNLMQAEWLGKEKRHSGDVINRLEQDVTKVTDVICSDVPQIFTRADRRDAHRGCRCGGALHNGLEACCASGAHHTPFHAVLQALLPQDAPDDTWYPGE